MVAELTEFFMKNYLIFLIIAAFGIFALIGYISENVGSARKKVALPTVKPDDAMQNEVERIKSSLANKSLNSIMQERNTQGDKPNNTSTEVLNNPTNQDGTITFGPISDNAQNNQTIDKL